MLSIVVPEYCELLLRAYEDSDCGAFLAHLGGPGRSLLFYNEKVTGFVVYAGPTDKLPPKTVYVEVQTKITSDEDPEPDTVSNSTALNPPEVFTAVLQSPVTQNGPKKCVSVWKFDVAIGSPTQEAGGVTQFRVSLVGPSKEPVKENLAQNGHTQPGQLENLFEGLNFHTAHSRDHRFQFSPHVAQHSGGGVAEHENSNNRHAAAPHTDFLLEIRTVLPLLLRLRSTKPGGRNDILLTTLSMEVSSELAEYAHRTGEKLSVTVLGVRAALKSGSIAQLGRLAFPKRCTVDDVLTVTYRLVSNDYLDTQRAVNAGGATKPLRLTVDVQVARSGKSSPSCCATNTITTLWAPVLDFGHMAPPISNWVKAMTTSPFQVQSQFASLAVLAKNGARKGPKLKSGQSAPQLTPSASVLPPLASAPLLGVAASLAPPAALSLAPPAALTPASSLAPSFALARPASPLARKLPSANSSPLLSARTVAFPKRTHRSLAALPSASAVTVNLGANTHSALSGVMLTFQGSLSMDLGAISTWKLQAINQSGRLLNLSVISKARRRSSIYLQGSSSSGVVLGVLSSNVLPVDLASRGLVLYSKQQLYSQYNQLKMDKGGVVVLTNDVRLGPLEPNEVFEAELQLIGIAKGIFNLDGLRVIDLSSGDGIDFGKLVEVFVV